MNNEITPSSSLEIIKSELKLELSKEGFVFQKLLQDAESITFTKENLDQDYEPLKKLRTAKGKLEKKVNPFLENWKKWNEGKKELVDALDVVLTKKTQEFSRLAAEIKLEREQQAKEALRIESIKTKMNNVLLDYAGQVAGAKTNEELLDIERSLNLETTRKSTYQEFLEEFKGRSESIRALISAQKSKIKELAALQNEVNNGAENASSEQILEATEKIDALEAQIQENSYKIQEEALLQASTPVSETVVGESTVVAPKARRTAWAYEVTDVQLLLKKHPELVEIVPNHKKIKELIAERRDAKTIVEEEKNGLKIFKKEDY